jgi:hypothetical protein
VYARILSEVSGLFAVLTQKPLLVLRVKTSPVRARRLRGQKMIHERMTHPRKQRRLLTRCINLYLKEFLSMTIMPNKKCKQAARKYNDMKIRSIYGLPYFPLPLFVVPKKYEIFISRNT